ncbi:MAG: hypothetical protein AB8B86_13650 [Pseudomonadales bacterium]
MNASTQATKIRNLGSCRGVPGLFVIAMLTITAPSAIAATSMLAAPAQAIGTQEASQTSDQQLQKNHSTATAAAAEPNNSSPDAGILALLALGLIALGVTRRKVRD